MLLVHPEGSGSRVSNEELNISFATTPDYSGIAKAGSAGTCYTGIANTAAELETILGEAVEAVESGISAVVDARVGSGPLVGGSEGRYNP